MQRLVPYGGVAGYRAPYNTLQARGILAQASSKAAL